MRGWECRARAVLYPPSPGDLGASVHMATRHQGDVTERDLSRIRPKTWLGAGAPLPAGRPLPRRAPKVEGTRD